MKHLKNNYEVSVPLRCIVCGSDDCFEFNDDKSFVKCTKCGKEYPGGYDELVSCNEAFIEDAKSARAVVESARAVVYLAKLIYFGVICIVTDIIYLNLTPFFVGLTTMMFNYDNGL